MEPRSRNTYDFEAGRIAGLEEALNMFERSINLVTYKYALKEVIRSLSKEEQCPKNSK